MSTAEPKPSLTVQLHVHYTTQLSARYFWPIQPVSMWSVSSLGKWGLDPLLEGILVYSQWSPRSEQAAEKATLSNAFNEVVGVLLIL